MAAKIIRRDVLVGTVTSVAVLTVSVSIGSSAVPKIHDVNIKFFKFEPEHIAVKAGDTIRWTNKDLAPHTATAREGSWDTGEIVKGDSLSIVVREGMETSYFCAFHPHMAGTIDLV